MTDLFPDTQELDKAWQEGYNAGLDDADCNGACGAYDDGYHDGQFDGREAAHGDSIEEGIEAAREPIRLAFLSVAEDLQRNLDFGSVVPWALDGVDPRTADKVIRELHRVANAVLEMDL